MRRIFIFAFAVFLTALLSPAGLRATEKPYGAAVIVSVEKKFHERVLYYLVNTPVTQDDPYYELSLRSGDLMLLTEFTPRHAADELPDGWKGGSNVELRFIDKHHVMVRQADGIELQLLIVKRVLGAGQSPASKPSSIQN